MIGKMEQEKIKNIDVDELEGKNKSIKKIKLDFNKSHTTVENNESVDNENEPSSDDSDHSFEQQQNSSPKNTQEEINDDKPEFTQNSRVPSMELNNMEPMTENNGQQPSTEIPEQSMKPQENNNVNSAPQGRNVFHPNGEINYNNLPKKFVSPKRLESMNRRGPSNINSPLDLAHYRPPLKSLEEINDPDYEKFVGQEPIPYGSNVFYEEPEITSPNLAEAIPFYNRPQINYRDNLINMSYGHYYPEMNNTTEANNIDDSIQKESEKKKEKKKDRKSLNFLHILKKSKSAENVKGGKSKTSKNKSATKIDNDSLEPKRNTSPPAFNSFSINGNYFIFIYYLLFFI